MKLWQCPKCGREFARQGQSHSCVTISVEEHFRGKPERLKRMLGHLLTALRKSGFVRVDAVKSGINLAERFHFAMVYVQNDGLKVEFALNRRLDDKRIIQTQHPSPNRVIHFVKVTREEEVDSQLLGWLREAQAAESWNRFSREHATNG